MSVAARHTRSVSNYPRHPWQHKSRAMNPQSWHSNPHLSYPIARNQNPISSSRRKCSTSINGKNATFIVTHLDPALFAHQTSSPRLPVGLSRTQRGGRVLPLLRGSLLLVLLELLGRGGGTGSHCCLSLSGPFPAHPSDLI
jgi:hypothetical protein